MPVRRFHDVSEMEERWYEPGDPRLYQAIRRLWDLGHRTIRPHYPPGVHRHHGIAEMNAATESWAAATFAAYRRRQAMEKARLERTAK